MSQSWRSALFMAGVAAVCAALPATVRSLTAARVRAHAVASTQRHVLEALGIPVPPSPGLLDTQYRRFVREEVLGGRTFWFGQDSAEGLVAFPVRGPGFWGPIHAVVAVELPRMQLARLVVTRHEETPGLGGRIQERSFTDQFRGIVLDERRVPLVKLARPGAPRGPSTVDALTGATETSRKLEQLLDTQVRASLRLLRERPT